MGLTLEEATGKALRHFPTFIRPMWDETIRHGALRWRVESRSRLSFVYAEPMDGIDAHVPARAVA